MENEKDNSRLMKYLPITAGALAFICGVTGYMLCGVDFYNSVLCTLSLVNGGMFSPSLGIGIDSIAGLLIEIARWLVLMLVFGLGFTVYGYVKSRSKTAIKLRSDDVVVVHGRGALCDAFMKQCKNALLSDERAAFKARKQVILFDSDEEAIAFCNEHSDDFAPDADIVVEINSARRESISSGRLRFTSSATNCARLYWNKYPVTKRETIVLIGNSDFGEALMTQALMTNLYSLNDGVEYHLFGDYSAYRMLKRQIGSIAAIDQKNPSGDSVFFHEDDWLENYDLISSANRVIVCGETEANITIAGELVTQWNIGVVYVRTDSSELLDALYPASRLIAFGKVEELADPDIILNEKLDRMACRFAVAYQRRSDKENGTASECDKCPVGYYSVAECIKCPRGKVVWNALSPVQQNSNMASADFTEERIRLLCDMFDISRAEFDRLDTIEYHLRLGTTTGGGKPVDQTEEEFYGYYASHRDQSPAFREFNGKKIRTLNAADRYFLLCIEHERWNRYYYMINYSWRKTPSNDDLAKLYAKRPESYASITKPKEYWRVISRTHDCLVPFDELPDYVKKYDFDAYINIK